MNKILIAIATVVFALGGMITSSAQAGFKTRLGIGLAIGAASIIANQHRYERRARRTRHHARRKAKRKVHVTQKRAVSPKPAVAEVEDTPIVAPVKKTAAISRNSSITTAALPPAEDEVEVEVEDQATETAADETPVPVEPAETSASDAEQTANKLDCKKFFPSVGMTLSVPCE